MNILKRLFARKPSLYDLRQKYLDLPGGYMTDDEIEYHLRRADKIARWVLDGPPTSRGASSPDRGHS